jgi:hypothetical protein
MAIGGAIAGSDRRYRAAARNAAEAPTAGSAVQERAG